MKKNPPEMENENDHLLSSLNYKPEDDIYNKSKREEDINPDDNSVIADSNEKDDVMNEKNFKNHMSGDDLDIPGAELDDNDEAIGEEDEENNYYSLGGDNHEDLEESKE